MSTRRHGDDDESFAAAMKDVVPLKDRDKARTTPPPPSPARPGPSAETPRFVLETARHRIEGRAENVGRKTLTRLRRGDFSVDEELDLHGLAAPEARRVLVQRLEAARGRGARCVLVIHGRGRHSEGAPVLRDALPEWLQENPLAELVMAFATAPANRGGSGAMLVLLRRAR